MKERVKKHFETFEKTLKNLEEAVSTASTDVEIDGTIRRFELCCETSWKLIKEWLADKGIVCKDLRDCFKYAYENDLIKDEKVWLEMIEDSNKLAHTCTTEESRAIFEKIKESYLKALSELYRVVEREKSSSEHYQVS